LLRFNIYDILDQISITQRLINVTINNSITDIIVGGRVSKGKYITDNSTTAIDINDT
jgi:hypothetical protein